MFLLYLAIVVICCFLTYKISCYQFIKLDKTNSKGLDIHQKYICEALDEIANIKDDVNQIKKDIYQ